MSWRRHFRAATVATEPEPAAIERLRAGAAAPGMLLRDAAVEPQAGAVGRLRARSTGLRRRRSWWPVLALPALAFPAFAAVWMWGGPPTPLEGTLEAATESVRTIGEVELRFEGTGSLSGTVETPHIHWDVGTLAVETSTLSGEPALTVETSEAVITVAAASLTVTRDQLGTTVSVERGDAHVRCLGDEAPEGTCLPATASGWLGRAFALRDAGDPGTLDAIDQGLRRTTAGDPMASELLALRIGVLLSNGQHAEALSAADAYLASGAAPRRDEVEKIAAAIRAGRLDLSAP